MFSPTPSPISRTVQYRKITKPLLERKRRARINRCLDELKDLMFTALEAEGENVDKLEKADILEFTVKHLQKITRRDPVEEAYKFQEGFSHCASEACSFLLSLPGLDSVVGRRLVEYLAKSVSRALESQLPSTANKHPAAALTATISPATVATVTSNNNNNNSNVVTVQSEAVARGHTPPSSDPPATPPGTTALQMIPCGPQLQTAASTVTSPMPHQRPVALTASNRGPHMVVRPKPTRPTFGRSSSSSPQNDAAIAAAAAAQRDPMWRPW